jgi:hypothetical protein
MTTGEPDPADGLVVATDYYNGSGPIIRMVGMAAAFSRVMDSFG